MWVLALAAALADELADARYEAGLRAWRAADPVGALQAASDATTLEPEHRPARLLAGYALLRLNADEAGISVLTSLAREPVSDAFEARIHAASARAVHKRTDRFYRDQWSLTMGFSVGPERGGDEWHVAGGHAWALGIPVSDGVTMRVDASHRWLTDTEDVGGWRVSPVLSRAWTRGDTAGELMIGPSFWIANGVWWESQYHLYVGARVAAAVDQRLGRRSGLRLEVGVTPAKLNNTLWWYGAPADARLSYVLWFGRPRSGPLAGIR